jgi:hypothetical protein
MSQKSSASFGTTVEQFLDRWINAGKNRSIRAFDKNAHETLLRLATRIKAEVGDKLYCLTEARRREFDQRVPVAAQFLAQYPDENEFEAATFTFMESFKQSRLKCKNCLAGPEACPKRNPEVLVEDVKLKAGLDIFNSKKAK